MISKERYEEIRAEEIVRFKIREEMDQSSADNYIKGVFFIILLLGSVYYLA